MTIAALLVAALAVAVVGPAPRASAQGAAVAALERELVELIERCEKSVVSISRFDAEEAEVLAQIAGRVGQNVVQRQRLLINGRAALPGALGGLAQVSPEPASSGAGVVIDDSGLVLTQFRVIDLGDTHLVTDVRGRRYLAKIRAADARSGLAVLAIEKRVDPESASDDGPAIPPALPIGAAEDLRKGRFVVAIGNPFAIESDGQPTASWGTVTNTALKVPQDENLNDVTTEVDGSYRTTLHHFGSLIQTDARLGWNANGGALVTLDGKLVGITTTAAAIAGHESPAGYAIPLNGAMRRAVDTMEQGLEPEYGLLGVNFGRQTTRSPLTGRTGIAVRAAYPGSPAQVAGIESNDLLLTVNGQPVRTPETLQLAIGSLPPNERVEVGYERAGVERTATVVLGKAYISDGQIVTRRPRAWRGLLVDYATAVPADVLAQKSATGHLDPEGCVVVKHVEEGSATWRFGVRRYAYISHVSGTRVSTPAEFYAAAREAGDNVKLKFTKPLPAVTPQDGGPPGDGAEALN